MNQITKLKKNDFSPEIKLILYCARTYVDSETTQQIQKNLGQGLDWSYLIETAIAHGVLPLLYHNLKLIDFEAIPNNIQQQLKNYAHNIALKNTLFLRELLKLLFLFKKYDIRAISFKGPVLAISAYQNLGLRHFCDLDILVCKQDFMKAFDLLTDTGYHPAYEWNFLNRDFELALRRSKSEYSFTNGIVSIDLHQDLTVERFLSSSFTLDFLWERRQLISISGHTLYSFGTEDLLMYLCIHGSKECWRSLKWICDVAECIQQHPTINWENLLQESRNLGCERMLLLGLLLAHEFLDVKLPLAVSKRIAAHPESRYLANEFSKRLFWRDNLLSTQFTSEKFFLHLRMIEKTKNKLGCLWDLHRPILQFFLKLVPNIKDKEFIPLPHYLYFLYYLIRPIRLLLR
ncbi:MAG: nucleotidyltransferase family protein [Acaryochloris sp. RU_4_1]|nr:nucleotidyltransferase family protein [Acaryochloris sp. RU_4_1]NJR53336.1 nucleotidyltransferase family protein [Acaryochloris sp. CRU_2_0]